MENRHFEVRCPHCDTRLSIEIGQEETVQTECPHCRTRFVVDSSDDPAPSEIVPAVPEGRDQKLLSATEEEELPTKVFGFSARMLIVPLAAAVFALVILLLIVLLQPQHQEINPPSDTEISPETILHEETAEEEGPVSASEEFPVVEEEEKLSDSSENEAEEERAPIESNYPDFESPETSLSELYSLGETSETGAPAEESSSPETINTEFSGEGELSKEEPPPSAESTEDTAITDSHAGDADSSPDRAEEDFDVDMYSRGDAQIFLPSSIEHAEPIDIEKRLSTPIREIRLAHAGLSDFIRLFYQLTGVPVELDWISFASPVPIWEKRIVYRASDLTADEFLHEFSTSFRLEILPQDGQIHLALTENQNEPVTTTLDCTDLVEEGRKGENTGPSSDPTADPQFPASLNITVLESALRDLVLDKHLSSGEAEQNPELVWEGSVLKLTANRRAVERSKTFFDRIRSLRHLPPKDAVEAELLIPENLSWDHRLSVPTNLCLLRPTPLSEVLYLLKRERGIDFFYDYAAIPGGGTILETPVKLIASEQPLEQILTELLAPLGLEWIVLTENLLAVTSPDRAELFDTEIHFYAAPDEDVSLERCAELIREIKENIAPSTWNPEGGGMIWIDPSSRSFLIRQTLRNQRRIRRFMQPGLVGKESS